MIDELPNSFLDFLDLSSIGGLPSHIEKSTNGLIFKREREENKSAQEYLATKYARFLLPETLKMPEIWGIFANHLISRYYPGRQLNKSSKDEVFRAVDYLIEMNDVKFNDDLKNFLIENHYCHYFGDSLKNRLEQELEFSVKAFGETEGMKDHLDPMRAIIAACLEAKKSYPVLGHGDFQAKNLLFVDNNIIPIDWVDFGISDRSYEIHHFLRSIDTRFQDEVYSYYLTKTDKQKDELDVGQGIDAVIRAGSRARQIANGEKKSTDKEAQKRFIAQIIRGSAIL